LADLPSMRVSFQIIKRHVIVFAFIGITPFGCVSHSTKPNHSEVNSELKLTPQERADYAYTQGEAYSQSGKPKKAVEFFKEALVYDPDSLEIKLRLATELVRVGAVRESFEIVEEILKQNPRYVKALMLKASLLSALKNNADAIRTFEAIVLVDPENSDAITSLGALYAEEQKYDLSIEQFQKLTRMKTYSTPEIAYYYLGRIFEEKGDAKSLDAALASYSKALELKPSYVDALMSAVSVHLQQKQPRKAQVLLEKWQASEGPNPRVAETLANLYIMSNQLDLALEQLRVLDRLNPQSHDVKLRMAVILMSQQQYQESAMLLESILVEVPDSDRVRYSLGTVYSEMQEWDKALYHLALVPHFSSYYVDAVVHAVSILRDQKNTEEAAKLLQAAIEKKDEVTQFYVLYATILDDQKKYEENSKFLAAAKEKFPESPMILFLYAFSFGRLNDKETALKWMQAVLEKDKNHALAMNFIAYTYAEQNRELDKALGLAKRANELEPNNPFIQDTLGWIYYQKGQYQTALVWLEKAFNGSKNESVIMDHLGDTYLKMGLLEKAQIMYDLALESSDEQSFKQVVKLKLQAIRFPDSKSVTKERIPAAVPKTEGVPNNQ